MEFIGLALSIAGLAGPLATVCMKGYDLLRSTAVSPQDTGDFHLRINTEMGLLTLWTKHWVDLQTGQIRAEAGREEVCFLAVDILGKIGTLLVDVEKLQGKYGIEMKSRMGSSQEEIEHQFTNIGGLETAISSNPPKSEGGVAVNVCPVDLQTSTDCSVRQHGNSAQGGDVGANSTGKKKSWIRRLIGKFRALMFRTAPKLQGTVVAVATAPKLAATANPDENSTTEATHLGEQCARPVLDVTHAPVEEVFATLDSTRVEVEAKLTIVQRMKWAIKDQEKVIGLVSELKEWNMRLFTLLPLPRLDPKRKLSP